MTFVIKTQNVNWCKNGVASIQLGYENIQNGMYRGIFYIGVLKGLLIHVIRPTNSRT
jgi:hypothetical protein